MKKTFVLFLCWFLIGSWAFAQKKAMSYYLPDGNYNPAIPTPESVLGFQIGEWHISHDKLVMYMQALANASDRITLTQYGRSYERRPLLYLTITAPQNQSRIKEIQQQHLSLSDPQVSAKLNTADMPAITYHGYCVHGNESSGANAALLFAYHLAAAQGPAIEKTLKEVIVLLDPCYNPDGFNRFASWVNVHKSKNLSADPANREFNEPFPGGRTNHYWFDLNRDWLPAQHPESQGRVKNFHEWKPLILTDHHEMGTDNTFFFQPGIATRTNPLTPDKNQELTYKIGTYHAKALDNIGSLYYAQESFDDFYYGKGSTYPDVNGSIGILFEQASSRGHLQESRHGILSFPFTIRNQLQTSLSTLAAAEDMRVELLDYHREFYRTAMEQAKKDNKKGYIFGTNKANNRVQELLTILQRHQIQVNKLEKDTRVSGQAFDKDHAYIVSLNQPQYRLIKAMFEKVTTFKDSLFYDVSAWTLPLAFNIPYAALNAADLKGGLMGKDLGQVKQKLTMAAPAKSDYAYLFEWDDYLAPNALNQLLKAGLMVKVANNSFTSVNEGQKVSYPPGTLMVPVQNNQTKTPEDIHALVSKASTSTGIRFVPAATG
ncbi:MAG: M14 metallopeptidase family protein, partial [Bacteroidota bacterium]